MVSGRAIWNRCKSPEVDPVDAVGVVLARATDAAARVENPSCAVPQILHNATRTVPQIAQHALRRSLANAEAGIGAAQGRILHMFQVASRVCDWVHWQTSVDAHKE